MMTDYLGERELEFNVSEDIYKMTFTYEPSPPDDMEEYDDDELDFETNLSDLSMTMYISCMPSTDFHDNPPPPVYAVELYSNEGEHFKLA